MTMLAKRLTKPLGRDNLGCVNRRAFGCRLVWAEATGQ
jgi:hypothetical protein